MNIIDLAIQYTLYDYKGNIGKMIDDWDVLPMQVMENAIKILHWMDKHPKTAKRILTNQPIEPTDTLYYRKQWRCKDGQSKDDSVYSIDALDLPDIAG